VALIPVHEDTILSETEKVGDGKERWNNVLIC
jgi:hypothetical protein